jgi:hypothetical protein
MGTLAIVLATGQVIAQVMAIGVNTAMVTIARDIAVRAATARSAGTDRVVMVTTLRGASTEKRGKDDEINLDTVTVCHSARGELRC